MKRMDRLMAILIALQQRPLTARDLAEKFEVSKRTILRDMQSLSEMGVPLYAVSGPSGGFRLMEGFRLPPLQLDSREAWTVLFALRAVAKMADAPFQQAKWTVMDKIRAILPEQTLQQVDPMLAYAEVEVPERSVKTPHLSVLLELTGESRWIRILYRSANHRRWLQLQPRRIYAAHGFWYCEAYSVTHAEQRTFRVDRMDKIEAIEEPSDLWKGNENPDANDGATMKPPVRIWARLTYRGALLAEQDTHIGEMVKPVSESEWELDFLCPAEEWNWAVRFFFAMGLEAEVLEPALLRQEIASIADQMGNRYRS